LSSNRITSLLYHAVIAPSLIALADEVVE